METSGIETTKLFLISQTIRTRASILILRNNNNKIIYNYKQKMILKFQEYNIIITI